MYRYIHTYVCYAWLRVRFPVAMVYPLSHSCEMGNSIILIIMMMLILMIIV